MGPGRAQFEEVTFPMGLPYVGGAKGIGCVVSWAEAKGGDPRLQKLALDTCSCVRQRISDLTELDLPLHTARALVPFLFGWDSLPLCT